MRGRRLPSQADKDRLANMGRRHQMLIMKDGRIGWGLQDSEVCPNDPPLRGALEKIGTAYNDVQASGSICELRQSLLSLSLAIVAADEVASNAQYIGRGGYLIKVGDPDKEDERIRAYDLRPAIEGKRWGWTALDCGHSVLHPVVHEGKRAYCPVHRHFMSIE